MVSAGRIAAEKEAKVDAEYTYYASQNESLEQAKRAALNHAKIEAIAERFGTVVSETLSTSMTTVGQNTVSRFHSVGGTDVRGEWVETTREPEYEIDYVDNMLVVKVKVSGKIRELRPNGIEFTAKALKNGTEQKFESTEFNNGDDLFLYFRTPVKGFVAAFLLDEAAGQCYCLLPYKAQVGTPLPVKKDTDYVFFSESTADEQSRGMVDEYTLTAGSGTEYNTIYVLFSPKEFARPASSGDTGELVPVATPYADFMKWLSKQRSKNKDLNCVTIPISIAS